MRKCNICEKTATTIITHAENENYKGFSCDKHKVEVMNIVEDMEIADIIKERMANFDPSKCISHEEMKRRIAERKKHNREVIL